VFFRVLVGDLGFYWWFRVLLVI